MEITPVIYATLAPMLRVLEIFLSSSLHCLNLGHVTSASQVTTRADYGNSDARRYSRIALGSQGELRLLNPLSISLRCDSVSAGECRCPPKRSLGERYSAALLSDPLKTKTATSFILSGISAIISKYYSNGCVMTPDIYLTALRMAALSVSLKMPYQPTSNCLISQSSALKLSIYQLLWLENCSALRTRTIGTLC